MNKYIDDDVDDDDGDDGAWLKFCLITITSNATRRAK